MRYGLNFYDQLGRKCVTNFKFGWWCSRTYCHEGPCALRPRWWNLGPSALRYRGWL